MELLNYIITYILGLLGIVMILATFWMLYRIGKYKEFVKTVESKDELLETATRLTNYVLKKGEANLLIANETELLYLLILSDYKTFVIEIKKNKRNKAETDHWYEEIVKAIPIIWPDAVLRTDAELFDGNKMEPESPSIVYHIQRAPIDETDLYV